MCPACPQAIVDSPFGKGPWPDFGRDELALIRGYSTGDLSQARMKFIPTVLTAPALAGGVALLLECFSPLFHLIRRYILNMSSDAPEVAERVLD